VAFDLREADDDVGDLDAGVVDVVLRFDRRPAEAQRAHQCVAERGVAQVADVGGLVRVDGRVLDDCFFDSRRFRRDLPARAGGEERRPLEKQVFR